MNFLSVMFRISTLDFGFPCLQHACLFETEITRAGVRWRADDDVIQQFDLQKLGGFGQASRQAVVSLARRWIAGWVIVTTMTA